MNKSIREITQFVGVFSLLFVMSFSFPFSLFPDIGGWLEPFFNWMVFWNGVETYHSGEDSLGMLLNALNILVITSFVAVLLSRMCSNEVKLKIFDVSTLWMKYYLATILMIYGFDKVYKWQFYAPESNILYTRVKDLSQDMLYWTTMGTSYSYSLFGGVLEVMAGALLLFRKTFAVGILLSMAVMSNVFFVNLGFDITVKLYSGFLLVLSIVLSLPMLTQLVRFFNGKKVVLSLREPFYRKHRYYLPLKLVVLFFIFAESQYKYFSTCNFNDDLAPRPHFNGAYEVIQGQNNVARIHFHRQGYFILEMEDDTFYDFLLDVDPFAHTFKLLDYDEQVQVLNYEEIGDSLSIYSSDSSFLLVAVKQNL